MKKSRFKVGKKPLPTSNSYLLFFSSISLSLPDTTLVTLLPPATSQVTRQATNHFTSSPGERLPCLRHILCMQMEEIINMDAGLGQQECGLWYGLVSVYMGGSDLAPQKQEEQEEFFGLLVGSTRLSRVGPVSAQPG